MNTFLGILGDVLPTSGTRLSVLSMELPRAITPEVAGLTVGAFVGVVGFIAVLLLVGRGNRRGAERRAQLQPHHQHPQGSAGQVVSAPYGTMPRDTPLSPAAFQVPALQPSSMPLPFRPSTDLSARVFAKMGYGADADDEHDSPAAAPEVSVGALQELGELGDDDVKTNAWASPFPAMTAAPAVAVVAPVSVSSIIVVEESGPVSALKSGPHPLGIIPTGSSAMQAARPASFADLDLDDGGATEIGETYFDEPPQPRRRTDPPKIRPIAPSGPRFPPAATQQLPQPTPPPARVSQQR